MKGDSHLLDKMKGIWQYLSELFENNHLILKKIRKVKSVNQYKKNIGRMVQVKPLEKGKLEGRLSVVDEKGITIVCSEKKRIEGRKKKEVVEEEFRFDFDKIKETKIVVSFK